MQPSGTDRDPHEERVRRDLARLGADAASAPEVPPAVTSRIGAALRAAPPPAHAVNAHHHRWSRPRVIAAIIGICAALAAIVIGAIALLRPEPAPQFPVGPTADQITISMSPVSPVSPVSPAVSTRR